MLHTPEHPIAIWGQEMQRALNTYSVLAYYMICKSSKNHWRSHSFSFIGTVDLDAWDTESFQNTSRLSVCFLSRYICSPLVHRSHHETLVKKRIQLILRIFRHNIQVREYRCNVALQSRYAILPESVFADRKIVLRSGHYFLHPFILSQRWWTRRYLWGFDGQRDKFGNISLETQKQRLKLWGYFLRIYGCIWVDFFLCMIQRSVTRNTHSLPKILEAVV